MEKKKKKEKTYVTFEVPVCLSLAAKRRSSEHAPVKERTGARVCVSERNVCIGTT